MADKLRKKEAGTRGVYRIVRDEIARARRALGGLASVGDESVHDARKSLKKVRAGLRLLRKGLGRRVYRRENATYRDAAKPLTEVRDAKILLETLDDLGKRFKGEVDQAALARVRQALREQREEVRHRVLESGGGVSPVKVTLDEGRKRTKTWTLDRRGWSVLGAGLKRVYRSGRDAYLAARQDPSVENLHEWRKQVKYLWHHLRILQPLRPAVLDKLIDQAHTLGDQLGDDHDLAVLQQKLTEEPEQFPDRATVETLVGLIDRRRRELQEQALALGERLYQKNPRAFVNRLERAWDAWHSTAMA